MLGVIGDLVEDVIVWLEGPVRHGTDTEARVFRRRGGSAANVASFAARAWPTRFIDCVGDDPVGERVVLDLANDGVDVRVVRRGETGTIVVLIDGDGERTMFPNRGASTLLDVVPDEWLSGLSLLHVPAYSFNGEPAGSAAIDAIRRVKGAGGLVSVDASSTGMLSRFGRDRFLNLMAELAPDFLLANKDESTFLGLLGDVTTGTERQRLPLTTVVTKSGSQATIIDAPDRPRCEVEVPAVGNVRDLTGAGDAFAAGFLSGYLRSRDLREAAVRGHASAARVLSSPGASATGG